MPLQVSLENRAGQTNGINFVTCSNGKVQLGGREGQMTMFEAYLSNLTGVYLLEISGLFPRFRSAGQPVYPHEPTGTTKIANPPCWPDSYREALVKFLRYVLHLNIITIC